MITFSLKGRLVTQESQVEEDGAPTWSVKGTEMQSSFVAMAATMIVCIKSGLV